MKKVILFTFVLLAIIACKNGGEQKAAKMPVTEEEKQALIKDTVNFTTAQWMDSTSKDLGKVKKGQVVEIPYTIKNTGDKPLIIFSVVPGCGCTVAEKPAKPIMPGKEEKIVAKFNSEGQSLGTHAKNVTVRANTKPTTEHILNFKVDIVE